MIVSISLHKAGKIYRDAVPLYFHANKIVSFLYARFRRLDYDDAGCDMTVFLISVDIQIHIVSRRR